jgi:hypothetical protein
MTEAITLNRLRCFGQVQRMEENTGCPTRYRTRLAGGPLLRVATVRRTKDTLLFISHRRNVLMFKFRCNIFIGVRIIKEIPGSVASGTPYRIPKRVLYMNLGTARLRARPRNRCQDEVRDDGST